MKIVSSAENNKGLSATDSEDGEAESSQGRAKSLLEKMIGKFSTKPFD